MVAHVNIDRNFCCDPQPPVIGYPLIKAWPEVRIPASPPNFKEDAMTSLNATKVNLVIQ